VKALPPPQFSLAVPEPNPEEVFNLDFQEKCAEQLVYNLTREGHAANMLRARVGLGKTYILCKAIRDLLAQGWFNDKPSPYPVIWLTAATVVEQTQRVLDSYGLGKKVFVTNYDQLRSEFGEIWLKTYSEHERGELVIKYAWTDPLVSKLVIFDECQKLKNTDSQQSRICLALTKVPGTRFIFSSASPFTRVCEAKNFAVSTRHRYKFGWSMIDLDERHWPDFAQWIAGNTDPAEHSPTACKRLREELNKYFVEPKGVQSKYHSRNGCCLINFQSPTEAEFYNAAYARYIEELAKIDRDAPGGIAAIWVAILKFRQAAELIKAPHLALAAWESVKAGKAAVVVCNFRATLAKVCETLHKSFKVSRDEISMVWGGLGKAKPDASSPYYVDESLDLDLGPQSRKARQKEIDRFQSGKSLYCLFTFKSGGVGLSLHHAKAGLRPRETFVSTTYSAIELVQSFGRSHRITSLSDTVQTVLFYRGTIEEQVADKVAIKLKCLDQIVASRESWADILVSQDAKLAQVRADLVQDIRQRERQAEVIEADDESLEGIYIEEAEDSLQNETVETTKPIYDINS